jgi:hypothetical protein
MTLHYFGAIEFLAQSHVRVGPENRDASESQYELLVAQRSRKFRALEKLHGKAVYWEQLTPVKGNANGTVVEINEFFLMVDGGTYKKCIPLDWITISFSPENQRYVLTIQG